MPEYSAEGAPLNLGCSVPEDSQPQKRPYAASEPATGLLSSRPATPEGDTSPLNWAGDSQAGDSQAGEPQTPPGSGSNHSTVLYEAGQSPVYLGRYRLERMLGRGGMGIVWLAFDPRLARQVAVKMIRPDAKLGPDALEQFLEEGRRLAALNHPDILPIYDCGNEGGVWYLVAEYVSRGTLADRLKKESLTFDQAAEIVAQIADAANYAHMRGLVHRDIKPANILLRDNGKPLLADFGLAIAEEEQLREAPGTLGTYAYMAPEQMLGESRFVDGRADIYSLGVVLYELLTGRLPYLASTPEEYAELKARRDPRPPRSVRADIPSDLEAICLKCLARQPAQRYTTAADLAEALQRRSRGRLWRPRWIVAAFAAAAIVIGLVWVMNAGRGAPPVKPPSAVVSAPTSEDVQPLAEDVVPVMELQVNSPASTWEVAADGESVRFFSDDLVLFQLGEYRRGNLEFSVEVEQTHWVGGLGVFWGYSPSADDRDRRQYETFSLYPVVGNSFRLRNALLEFSESKNGLVREHGLAVYWFPEEPTGRSHRIGLAIRDGKLAELHWDALDLDRLLTERTRSLEKLQPLMTGGFGLVGNRSHGVFSKPMLNGRPLRFSPAPKSRSAP